jgi:catechol 2,3-dioxygenase-like lactoylglutathione lyase family enzyme
VEARISLITLGVGDLARARSFYHDGLGWPISSASTGDVIFLRTGGIVLALFPRELLALHAGLAAPGSGFGGIALAHNVPERDGVDRTLGEAISAGATLLKAGQDTDWGGRSGYFADPDGYPWEIAWNPFFPMAADGSIELPV